MLYGVQINGCLGGALLGANVINMPASNNGAGPGGAPLLGSGYNIIASSNVTINDLDVNVLGTGTGVVIYANGATCDSIVFGTGTVSAGANTRRFRLDSREPRYVAALTRTTCGPGLPTSP